MGIESFSNDVVIVTLPSGEQLIDELQKVTETVLEQGDFDALIDFSDVDIITTTGLSKLLGLRKALADCEHRLVFCSIPPAAKGVFTVTSLDGIFEIVDDKLSALEYLKRAR